MPSSLRGHGAKKRSTSLSTPVDLWHNPGEGNLAMNFCSNCGAPVSQKVPPGDNLPRFVCDACQAIHYENPKIVVGCIPECGSSTFFACVPSNLYQVFRR